ncbi:MAG TPA: FAD-linked oxidase C-terminal domain-containing protein [Candidatus Thiothrix moscowensis]|uniref:FAD-linked oxidase C-terminal domain-containing protein n=1 Tax=unclassified Thiothrix TaxID=2636184 RepID=UPI0025FB5616|nr:MULTISPECIES: FAD-linked oxidase C-terminal domain-containing protein [unclassified Thiothrix]HRJ53669.1 FAD-linked oxidase C-terminal domain-containing protein [Candidatus Thiothrix moscowensis]HRJ93751.1 FAD-linked oxidase C-terminal domain-containing protein [Candidatus Thiothrix moscowensis]
MQFDPDLKARLLFQFNEILPAECILTAEEDLRPYECDGLTAYRRVPLAVVLPVTTEQVQQVVQTCARMNIPVVARGAGTGLSGGALPEENGIILGLSRLNKILEVDTDNLIARVQPGVRNLAISQAVDKHGLFYAPDPSSQIACSIGGNVAENSGGVHCLKYGLTVHNIQQIRLVTIDGELVTIGTETLDNPGYDLLALLTGSEGMLGIVVEVTVKLTVKPQTVQVLMADFPEVVAAGEAVAAIISSGIIPAGLEMMDNPAIRAAEAFAKAGYPVDAAAILLCELDGTETEVAEQAASVSAILQRYGASNIHTATTASERAKLWAGRKSAFPAVGRISPDYYCMDGTIPRKHLAHVLQKINDFSEQYGLRVANVFHAGDGNLHPLILYDANRPGELEKAEQFGADILALCVKVGGSITGEHGVGHEKIDSMCVQFTEPALEMFHAIKRAFDPAELLNPGKAVPTLHRCAELGAMHVHRGQLSHPELPRF